MSRAERKRGGDERRRKRVVVEKERRAVERKPQDRARVKRRGAEQRGKNDE